MPLIQYSISPLLKAISLNLAVKNRFCKPVDPSNFLWALQRKITSLRKVPFNFNTQQDVVEILHVVLDEVKGSSTTAADMVSTTLRHTITCNSCFCTSINEEKHDILTLPTSCSLKESFENFLSSETLCSQNQWFCPVCEAHKDSIREHIIVKCPPILIVQLNRFKMLDQSIVKDEQLFSCFQASDCQDDLVVFSTNDMEVSFLNKYSLVSSINHSGTMDSGHYWAYIKGPASSQWLSCNDKIVLPVERAKLNNRSSYVLIYLKK